MDDNKKKKHDEYYQNNNIRFLGILISLVMMTIASVILTTLNINVIENNSMLKSAITWSVFLLTLFVYTKINKRKYPAFKKKQELTWNDERIIYIEYKAGAITMLITLAFLVILSIYLKGLGYDDIVSYLSFGVVGIGVVFFIVRFIFSKVN